MMKYYSSLLISKELGCNKGNLFPKDDIPNLPNKGILLGNNHRKMVFHENDVFRNDVFHNIRDDAYYILLLILFLLTKK